LITPTLTGCTVTAGQWYSVYDGVSTTDPSSFDVDHVVPLAEAWDSGAASWATSRRELFANNLDLADHLAAVSASSNRSKGDRDPAEWLPTLTADHCRYMTAWVVIKAQWGLTIDPAENTAIANVLNGCPSLPVDQVLEGDNITPPNPTPPSPTPPPPPTPGCDPAYPTVCIPPPPPDLNCGDIPFTNFTVLAPDPHNFDGNNDGIGCQS
jgi:hypothetical protein